MRTIVIFAIAVGTGVLCACTSDGQREAAIQQCHTVGVSQSDPQFDLCTRSYSLQANQDNLEVSYRRALNPTYDNSKIGHQWYGY